MTLKSIPALKEIIIPVVPEKKYSNLFITFLRFAGKEVIAQFQHYNYDTKELLPGSETELIINDLYKEIDRVPIAGPIIEQLITLLVLLKREQQLQDNPEKLEAVRKQLGFK